MDNGIIKINGIMRTLNEYIKESILDDEEELIDKIKSNYTEENETELKLWEEIRQKGENSRRAGCGATGLADAIAMMGMKLDEDETIEIINNEELVPNENIVYFGDTARVPYGSRSKETVIKYTFQAINFLISKNVKAIVIACNTATAISLELAQQKYNIPIINAVSFSLHLHSLTVMFL